jgi:xylan 1,4-beta-xylosidase
MNQPRPHPRRIRSNLRRTLVSIAGIYFLAASLSAQTTTPPRKITADVTRPAGPHSPVPLLVIGAGRAAEGLRPDWQAQLATLQSEIGFHYLRFHGILSDEMGLYTEDPTGTPSYHFEKIDQLYDFLLAHHIKPFVELTFMPRALASGKKTIFWYSANVTPPKDMAKWQALVHALIQHWIDRYGRPEVESWFFEVWNEPDYPAFFGGTMKDYFRLYRATAQAIKQVCPACRVGGPAAVSPNEKQFLDYLITTHVPADFISTHTYGVLKQGADSAGHIGAPLDPSPNAIVAPIRAARQQIDRSPLPQLPLYITEWSSSYLPDDPFHDQYLSAPYIVDLVRQASPYAAALSYWIFTDIFEERGPQTLPFYGGFGLLTLQGIRKPSFFAYRFLSQLGPTDLTVEDPANQSWITTTGGPRPAIQALLWNYTPNTPPQGQIDQTFYKKEFPTQPAAPIDLTLEHLAPGRYTLTLTRIGYQQNDPYTAYLGMGSPTTLSPQQLQELQANSTGAPAATRAVTIKKSSEYHEIVPIQENSVVFLTLTPIK